MAILSIASFISLSLIMISERLFPFFCGFNDTSGMSFGVVKTDLYFTVSMLASFFGSSSYLLPTFKGPMLLAYFLYLNICKMLWYCLSLTGLHRINNGNAKAENDT